MSSASRSRSPSPSSKKTVNYLVMQEDVWPIRNTEWVKSEDIFITFHVTNKDHVEAVLKRKDLWNFLKARFQITYTITEEKGHSNETMVVFTIKQDKTANKHYTYPYFLRIVRTYIVDYHPYGCGGSAWADIAKGSDINTLIPVIPAPAVYGKGDSSQYRIDHWTEHRPPVLVLGEDVEVERCNVANAFVQFRIKKQTKVNKWFNNTPLYSFLTTSEKYSGCGITIDKLPAAQLKKRLTAEAGAHIQSDQQFLQFRKTDFKYTQDSRDFTYLLNALLAFVVKVDGKEVRSVNELKTLMSGVKQKQAFQLPETCRSTPESEYTINDTCKAKPFLLNEVTRKAIKQQNEEIVPPSVNTLSSKELPTLCDCCGKPKLTN